MSILYGNTDVETIKYNNTELDKVIYNGTNIWEQSIGIPDLGINKINPSIVGDIVHIHANGENSDEWRIIGINHDDTENTIDVIKINVSNKFEFDTNGRNYKNSTTRKYLNTSYYNALANEAKSHIQTMNVSSDGEVLQDKVKLISYVELGVTENEYALNTEGTRYEYFDIADRSANSKRIIMNNDGNAITYWTRTTDLSTTPSVWCVHNIGNLTGGWTKYYYIAPVIRLA